MIRALLLAELQALLQRNLFLTPERKAQILAASPAKQVEVLPLIQTLDAKQTALFKKVLTKNSHFFAELDTLATHEILERLMAEEAAFHVEEINQAEAELLEKLEQI